MIEVTVSDVLKDNRRLYAHKARCKKIALISLAVSLPKQTEAATIDLGEATLTINGKCHSVEAPDRLLRKFSKFTWDFLFSWPGSKTALLG